MGSEIGWTIAFSQTSKVLASNSAGRAAKRSTRKTADYPLALVRISLTWATNCFLAAANSLTVALSKFLRNGGGGSLIHSGLNFRTADFVVILLVTIFSSPKQ